MSSTKTQQSRLSLLAGSSLMAAMLSVGTFTGVALTPQTARAANECAPIGVDPSANGATADSYACSSTPYATGITYSSNGNLTVTKTNTGTTTVTANGVNLTGNGSDSVTWDSSLGTVTGGAGTAGPVIDVTSGSGAINITTLGVTGTTAGTTHAIRATSTGGGAITISRLANGTVNNNVAGGVAAIEAVTNGGDINVTTRFSTTGRLRGILARTNGAGAVTMTLDGGITSASTTDGVAAIDATAGTGGVKITIASNSSIQGGAGAAIIAASTGGVLIDNVGGTIGSGGSSPTAGGAVNFSGVTGGGVTFNNAGATASQGRWLATGASVFSAGDDVLSMTGVGQNIMGAQSSIDFGAGADTFNMAAFFEMGSFAQDGASIDFGSGADAFNMSGVFVTSRGLTAISNLETFNNSGVIYFGADATLGQTPNVIWSTTNGVAEDVLVMPGTAFTGSGDSRLVMDVNLDASEQAGCATMTGAADCLDLRGGSTAGSTLVTINNITPDAAQGAYSPVGATIVDVQGGTSAAGDFVLDPNTPGYVVDPIFGAAVDRPGLFRYGLRYDAATQRHNIVGLPRSETMEYAMLPSAARSVWYMTSDTITNRQADLRAGSEGEVWLRASGEYSKRDLDTGFESFGDDFTFDNSYKLYAGTIIGGMDFVNGTSGGYDYVLGGQIGYVSSSFDLDASESSGRMTGATGGVYASVWNRRFFLDTTFNANGLTLDYDQPGLGSKTNTWLRSVGAQAEAGMRYMLGERFYAEPLVSAAFVYTTFEELSLFGGEIQPADAHSRRAALGLRVGADYAGESVNWSYFATGRLWNEFDGESRVVVKNPGADLIYADDFSGTFSEFEAGLSVANDSGTISGFVSSGVKAQDGYSAVDLSAGVRLRW